jgi:hypothetical protein
MREARLTVSPRALNSTKVVAGRVHHNGDWADAGSRPDGWNPLFLNHSFAEAGDLLVNGKGGANGTLRGILQRHAGADPGHDCIADAFFDYSFIPADDSGDFTEYPPCNLLDIVGGEFIRYGWVTGEVEQEDGDKFQFIFD